MARGNKEDRPVRHQVVNDRQEQVLPTHGGEHVRHSLHAVPSNAGAHTPTSPDCRQCLQRHLPCPAHNQPLGRLLGSIQRLLGQQFPGLSARPLHHLVREGPSTGVPPHRQCVLDCIRWRWRLQYRCTVSFSAHRCSFPAHATDRAEIRHSSGPTVNDYRQD